MYTVYIVYYSVMKLANISSRLSVLPVNQNVCVSALSGRERRKAAVLVDH